MSNVLIEENDIKNIANSIRAKNDSSNKYKVREMSNAIDLLPKPSGNYNVSENGTYDITNYENVIVSVSGGQITLQSKDVIVTSAGTTTVTADTGYDGLSDVDITLNTETKIVKSTNQSQTITPTTNKFIDEITVQPISLQNKIVTPTSSQQTVTADNGYDGLGTVTVEAGGGSQYVIDYAEIGYDFIPQSAELDGVNYAKKIMENWDSSITSANQLYQGNTNLLYFPMVDTSNVTDASRCFRNCTNLKVVPLIDTSNFTFCNRSFEGDTNLVDIPQFDFSKVTALNSIFLNCPNLSDESLNNIMAICINATAFMQAQAQSNWRLSVLGLSSSQKTRCQSLSNWNAFVNAGWSA